jgi:hypothetical protein
MVRNLFFSKRLTILLYLVFGHDGKFLDYAGGYGVFFSRINTKKLAFKKSDKEDQAAVEQIKLFYQHMQSPILGRLGKKIRGILK